MVTTEDRIGRVEDKIDDMAVRLGRVEGVQVEMNNRIDDVHRRVDDVHKRLDDVHKRLTDVNNRLNLLTGITVTQTIAIVGLVASAFLGG